MQSITSWVSFLRLLLVWRVWLDEGLNAQLGNLFLFSLTNLCAYCYFCNSFFPLLVTRTCCYSKQWLDTLFFPYVSCFPLPFYVSLFLSFWPWGCILFVSTSTSCALLIYEFDLFKKKKKLMIQFLGVRVSLSLMLFWPYTSCFVSFTYDSIRFLAHL